MTLEQLLSEDGGVNQIGVIYNAMRNGMQASSTLQLPYTIEERKLELIENIADSYSVWKDRAVCKIVRNQYNDGVRVFCYAIEVVGVPRSTFSRSTVGAVDFIGYINSTPSVDGGEGYFQGGAYRWEDKKTGETKYASSIKGILAECGFIGIQFTEKIISELRLPCIFYVNLICPVINWLGGAGKTRIDLDPFADDIAATVSSVAYKMPTCHGRGLSDSANKSTLSEETLIERATVTHRLTELLRKRWEAVQQDESLKVRFPWTQSTVFYTLRRILLEHKFEPEKSWGKTRKYITSLIDKICKAEFGVEREALGIIAAARGVLYLDGQQYRVRYKLIESLALKGVAIVFIEKEGIVESLASQASDYGVALVNTQGRLVKYVKRLIKAARKSGAKVAILTDYDAIGIQIAMAAPAASGITRIGIDRTETIIYFQQHGFPNLTQEQLEEEYLASVSTDEMEDGKYLETKRIELDSLVAEVGPEALWKFVADQLKMKFPKSMTYDYNRVIPDPIPTLEDDDVINDVRDYIDYRKDRAARSRWEEISTTDLQSVDDLIKVEDKKQEIDDELSELVAEDERMKVIISKFEEVKTQLKIDSDDDFTKYRKEQEAKVKEGAVEAVAEAERGEPVDVDDIEFDDSESDEENDENEEDDDS